MSADTVGFAFVVLGIVLLMGKIMRVNVRWTQSLFLPSSILAGFIGLILGPDIFGELMKWVGIDQFASAGIFTDGILDVWSSLPGLLITVVFATLFLGEPIPNPVRAGKLLGPQLSLGISFATGQYVVGLILALVVLVPVLGLPPMSGALIEIGFEGGHGTAAGMAPVMDKLGFDDGGDLALGMATVGLVGGILIGVATINWGVRTGRTRVVSAAAEQSKDELQGLFRKDEQYPAAMMTTRTSSVEPLALHVAVIALAVLIGWLFLTGLQELEQALWAESIELLAYVPLFPLAMLGGVVVQIILDRSGRADILNKEMMVRVQGLALDLLIVSALATISLEAIGNHIGAFLLLAGAGIALNFTVLRLLAPRTIPDYWFERSIGDFGQSMGVTATGLILMRIVDPNAQTPAFEAFGYKQLVFEPFFGGGLITATMVPLIHSVGPWPPLIAMAAVFVVSVTVGLAYFGRRDWRISGIGTTS